ncbi:MAG: hypothetical protein KDA68_08830 [Planctomycetaceae bacterium]|nr:hypothetical protein [Planctomycetaceae bacterium]
MSFVTVDQVRAWLVGDTDDCIIADQDGVWVVSEELTPQQWCMLFHEPNAIPERRDEIAYVLCLLFRDHLESSETRCEAMSPEEREEEFKLLSDFILQNWQAFYGTPQEPAMGGDFDEILLPFLRTHSGELIPEREPRMQSSSAKFFHMSFDDDPLVIDKKWLSIYAVGVLIAVGLAILLQIPTEKLLIQVAAWIMTGVIFYAIYRYRHRR